MPLYDFRLRFNFHEAYCINSDLDQLELLILPHGEKITLRCVDNETAIKEHARIAIIGGPYKSEHLARTAAEKSKLALLYWAIEKQVGINFGARRQNFFVSEEYLAMLQKQYTHPLRLAIHAIDVHEHDKKFTFFDYDAKAKVAKNPQGLIDTFRCEYLKGRQLSEKKVLACEIYTGSFFDTSPRTRFITLVTAIEALLEQPNRSDEVQALVKAFIDTTKQQLMIDEPTKASIISSLDRIKRQSIGQAGRALARRLLPDQYFDEKPSDEFFYDCYEKRSQILHDGAISDASVDIVQLANNMENFVHHLLIAVLNNEPQQDTVAEAGTES